MYEIKKGIPIPESKTKKGLSMYPFSSMSVGDVVFINDKSIGVVRSNAYSTARREKIKLCVRGMDDGSVGVWRVE